jgi:acyl dehydratase
MTTKPEVASQPKLYLEDLYPGQRFRCSASYEMNETRMKEFASEFDPQVFHLDEAAGAKSVFKGLAASGWHTAAASMRLMADSELTLSEGLIGVNAEISWPRPTRAGDTLRLEIEILEIKPSRSKPQQGLVQVRFTTLNQHDEVAQTLTAWLLAFRKEMQ